MKISEFYVTKSTNEKNTFIFIKYNWARYATFFRHINYECCREGVVKYKIVYTIFHRLVADLNNLIYIFFSCVLSGLALGQFMGTLLIYSSARSTKWTWTLQIIVTYTFPCYPMVCNRRVSPNRWWKIKKSHARADFYLGVVKIHTTITHATFYSG